MDPVAALEKIDNALFGDGTADDIVEYGEALIGWLEKGGFRSCGPNGTDWRGQLTTNQLASVIRMTVAAAKKGLADAQGA